MAKYRHSSLEDIFEIAFGLLFWIAILLVSIQDLYCRIALGIIAIVILVYSVVSYYQRHKCPHGIYKGNITVSGKYKCSECQAAYEQLLEKNQQEERQKQFEKECKRKYEVSKRVAREKKVQGIKLSENQLLQLGAFEFEDYVATLLPLIGYKCVKQTPRSNDGGKDIICLTQDNEKCFVECKRYESEKSIGRPVIQKLGGAMAASHVTKGLFFATCGFSSTAIDEAKKLNIELFDLKRIEELFLNTLTKEAALDTYTLTCPTCGEPVVFKYFHDKEPLVCKNKHQVLGLWHDELRMNQWKKAHTWAKKHNISI